MKKTIIALAMLAFGQMGWGQELNNKVCFIKSSVSTKVIDYHIAQNGEQIKLIPQHGGRQQQWKFVWHGDNGGWYSIHSIANDGLALCLQNNQQDNFPLKIFNYNGGVDFRWKVSNAGNGKYYFESAWNGKVMDAWDGVNVGLVVHHHNDVEQWELNDVGNTGGGATFTQKTITKSSPDRSRSTNTLSVYNGQTAGDNHKNKSGNPKQNGNMVCQTDYYSLNLQTDQFLNVGTVEQASHIYPGAIYTYNNFMRGQWGAVEKGRNPVTLITGNRNISGNASRTVNEPTEANIQNAITNFYQSFNGHATNGSYASKTYMVHSREDFALAINGGGHGFGFQVDDAFKLNTSSDNTSIVVDATQEYFSINCNKPSNGFFSDAAVQNSLDNPMVISSVTYGRRVLISLEIKNSSQQISNDFKSKYDGLGWGAYLDWNFLSKQTNNSISASTFIVGGDAGSIRQFTTVNELKRFLDGYFANAAAQDGVPVKYELSNMEGQKLMSKSATDEYASPSCYIDGNNLQVWLAGATQESNPAAGWTDIEIFDRNGNSVACKQLFDGRWDCALATMANSGRTCKVFPNLKFEESKYNVVFNNINSDLKSSGFLRIWIWYKDGDYVYHSREALKSGSKEQHSPLAGHNNRDGMGYYDIPLSQISNGQVTKPFSFYTDQHTPGQLGLQISSRFSQ